MNYLEEKINRYKNAGFADEEIEKWKIDQVKRYKGAGFTNEEITESLGIYSQERLAEDKSITDPIDNWWKKRTYGLRNKAKKISSWAKNELVGEESQIYDFWKAGLGESSANFVLQYHTKGQLGYDWKNSYKELADDGLLERLARTLGTLVGDAPIGASTYFAAQPFVGPIGGGFASGFAVESIKKTYYEALKSGKVSNYEQWWNLFIDRGVYEGIKGGAMFGGTLAGPAILAKLKVPSSFLTTLGGTYLGMIGAGTTINSLEQGKLTLPSKQELVDTAALVTTLGAGVAAFNKTSSMILNRMSKTGESAADVTKDIVEDPLTAQEVASENVNVFSKTLTAEGQKRIETLQSELTEIKKIADGKESRSKEDLVKDKLEIEGKLENTQNQDEIFTLQDDIEFINKQLQEFEHISNPNNKNITSKTQEKIENELKELGVYVKKDDTTTSLKEEVKDKDVMDEYVDEYIEFENEPISKESSDGPKFSKLDRFIYNRADPGRPTKVIEDALIKDGAPKTYMYESLTNLSSVSGKASAWIKGDGVYNILTDEKIGKPLIDRLEGLGKLKNGYNRFSGYETAKRVIEKTEQGADLNIDIKKSKEVIKKGKKNYEKYSKEVQDIYKNFRDTLEAAGLISKDLKKKIEEMNKDYIPFAKMWQTEAKTAKGVKELGGLRMKKLKGVGPLKSKIKKIEEQIEKVEQEPRRGVLQDPIKRKKLKELNKKKDVLQDKLTKQTKIFDPLEVMATDIIRGVSLAERNLVTQKFVKTLLNYKKKNPKDKKYDWFKEVKIIPQEIKVMRKDLEKTLPEEILNKLTDEDISALSIFRKKPVDLQPTQISVMIDGKRKIYDVGDEILAQSITKSKEYNKLYEALDENIFFQAAQKATQIKRLGIILDPVFQVSTALTQDILNALTVKGINYYPIIDLTRGIVAQIGITKKGKEKAKKVQQSFERELGRTVFTEADQKYFRTVGMREAIEKRRFIDEILPNDPVAPYLYPYLVMKNITIKGLPRALQGAGKIITKPTQMAERASRIVIRERKIKVLEEQNKKLPINERLSKKDISTLSTFEARNIQDFSRIGARMEVWNKLQVFLTAGIEGLYKTFNTATTPELATRAIKVGVSGITLPTMLLWFANKDSETYRRTKDWEKANFWIFVTNEEKGEYIKLRKPWEFGYLFATLPERFLEHMFATDKYLANQVERNIFKNAAYYFLNYVPFMADVFIPFLEDGFNRNLYTQRKISPQRFDREIAEFEVTPYTSEAAKRIGEGIRFLGNKMGFEGRDYGSPHKIDHYIRGYLGPVGADVIKSLDVILRKSGDEPKKYVKPWANDTITNLTKIPVVGYFFQRRGLSAEPLEKYWDNYKKILPYVNKINKLIEEDRLQEAKSIMTDWQIKLAVLVKEPHKVMQTMYEIHSKLNAIEDTPDAFTPAQLDDAIDGNIENLIKMAELMNEQVYKFREELKGLQK